MSEMNAVVSDRTNACERERRSRIGRKTSEKHPANFSISAAKFARATPDAVLRRRVLFILRLHTEKPIPRFWFFLKRAILISCPNQKYRRGRFHHPTSGIKFPFQARLKHSE